MSEAERLHAAYREAVGWALQYRIKVYLPGTGRPGDLGPWQKSLGQLREEVRAAQGKPPHTFEAALAAAYERAETRS